MKYLPCLPAVLQGAIVFRAAYYAQYAQRLSHASSHSGVQRIAPRPANPAKHTRCHRHRGRLPLATLLMAWQQQTGPPEWPGASTYDTFNVLKARDSINKKMKSKNIR